MSLHFLTHSWVVEDRDDGPLVRLSPPDFDRESLSSLADELFELVQESGAANLSLDFAEIHSLSSLAAGKLFALDRRLRQSGGRLTLLNRSSHLAELLQVID